MLVVVMIEILIGFLTPIFYFGHTQAMEEIEKEELMNVDNELQYK